ncbi:MAG: hypothetical protein HGB33_00005, partial [Syntrophaceae bacterium]|nr:hypothetical protein [Syntrophaceae bacterium]
MAEIKIGEVVKFFSKPSVAAVKITDGELNVGFRFLVIVELVLRAENLGQGEWVV